MRIFIFLFFLVLCPVSAFAWEGRVVEVMDGNTIVVEQAAGGDRVKIRLFGIDTPELRQPFGQEAKKFVAHTALDKHVDIKPLDIKPSNQGMGRDGHGHMSAIVAIPDEGILQEMLLTKGLTWVYPQHCLSLDCASWESLQKQATQKGKGLWAEKNPIPPWEWRRQNRNYP